MPEIKTAATHIKSGFITREDEKNGFIIRSLKNIASPEEVAHVLNINRDTVAAFLAVPDARLCMCKQIHGTKIAVTDDAGIIEAADGLITTTPGLAIGVLVADCAALLFSDHGNGVIAAVHAGWRGASEGIVSNAVEKFKKAGADLHRTNVYISPCISQASFEVGEEVASRFPDSCVDRSKKKPHIDLQGFIQSELVKGGIPRGNITRDSKCTFKSPDKLHSHRRDGLMSGRMMAVTVMKQK